MTNRMMIKEEWHDSTTLVDRLRGRYGIPIRDGGGLVGGDNETPDEMVYTRTMDQSMFPQTPIMHEAALRIEELEAEIKALRDNT